jgi:hypothetical protein
LGYAESLRRSAEMKLFGDGDEIPELTEFYGCGHEVNTLSSAPTVRLPFEDLLHVLSRVAYCQMTLSYDIVRTLAR